MKMRHGNSALLNLGVFFFFYILRNKQKNTIGLPSLQPLDALSVRQEEASMVPECQRKTSLMGLSFTHLSAVHD